MSLATTTRGMPTTVGRLILCLLGPAIAISGTSPPAAEGRIMTEASIDPTVDIITYESFNVEFQSTLDAIGATDSFPIDSCAGWPTPYNEDIYILLYGADQLNVEELAVFRSIFMEVMTSCTGGCYTVEDVDIMFQFVDEFEFDEYKPGSKVQKNKQARRLFLDDDDDDDEMQSIITNGTVAAGGGEDGEGSRELQRKKRKKKRNSSRGRRNIVKTRVRGKRWSSKNGESLSLTPSNPQAKVDDSITPDGDAQPYGRSLSQTEHCGDALKNRLIESEYPIFACIAVIQITLFDPRCSREEFGGDGGSGTETEAAAPESVSPNDDGNNANKEETIKLPKYDDTNSLPKFDDSPGLVQGGANGSPGVSIPKPMLDNTGDYFPQPISSVGENSNGAFERTKAQPEQQQVGDEFSQGQREPIEKGGDDYFPKPISVGENSYPEPDLVVGPVVQQQQQTIPPPRYNGASERTRAEPEQQQQQQQQQEMDGSSQGQREPIEKK